MKQTNGTTIDCLGNAAKQWRTPDAPSGGGVRNRTTSQGAGHQVTIAEQAESWKAGTTWPTPNANPEAPNMSTTREDGKTRNRTAEQCLGKLAKNWPTPGANDQKGSATPGQRRGQLDEATEQLHTHLSSPPPDPTTPDGPASSPTTHGSRRRLNPAFVSWLMGWPCHWTAPGPIPCGREATESWRSLALSHLKACFNTSSTD